MELEFGYLPERLDVEYNGIAISTLPQFDDSVSWVSSHPNLRQKWFYPGVERLQNLGTGHVVEEPFAIRVFGLPTTHSISAPSNVEREYIEFALWVLSFFRGMRLTTLQQGFLDTTPIKPHQLVDFMVLGEAVAPLKLAEQFWSNSVLAPRERNRLCAAIHTLFISSNPRLVNFERFQLLYSALDACHAILKDRNGDNVKVNHAMRVAWMCESYGLSVPSWAVVTGTKSELSTLRNGAVHEGLYGQEPFGFAFLPQSSTVNLEGEMKRLVCRLLAKMLCVTDQSYYATGLDYFGLRVMNL